MATASTESHPAYQLLSRAHSPDTAHRIFLDKIIHKPLLLRPSSPPPSAQNARDRRQQARLKRRELRRKSNKPRPLSAKRKRALCVYEIPKGERKYELYVPLKRMWDEYMREILRIGGQGQGFVTPAGAGPILASAEYVGAEMEVVRSRCVSRVGLKGIVVKDSKFVFEIITERNEIKTVPKEYTIFRLEIAVVESGKDTDEMAHPPPNMVFEIHGEQFKHRAPDRANKKFKQHSMDYL